MWIFTRENKDLTGFGYLQGTNKNSSIYFETSWTTNAINFNNRFPAFRNQIISTDESLSYNSVTLREKHSWIIMHNVQSSSRLKKKN